MPNSSDSEALPSTGAFTLRGSPAQFFQRSVDIFGGLQVLENAHKQVTKATRAERDIIKKTAWRETKPAVESLETEREKRDQKPLNDGPFKIPSLPPPLGSHGKRQHPRGVHYRSIAPLDNPRSRDPSRWTHYSLAHVDEDGGLGEKANMRIAADLIQELRRRREDKGEEDSGSDGSTGGPHLGRILFRSTRGTKHPRMESADSDPSSGTTSLRGISVSHSDDLVEDCADNDVEDGGPDGTTGPSSTQFRSRRRCTRQCARVTPLTDDGGEECEEGSGEECVEINSSNQSGESEPETDDGLEVDVPEGL